MKASRFNVFYPLEGGNHAIYNTRTGSLLEVTDECYQSLSSDGCP